ncbi:hypothetical protein EVAR_100338_1 [Eumeta japonica]|uniref:Uncharacterized protein n=1 Tax=Eumeta variegata TaxID=151549 RepID=A0A4C1T4J7_EUMVA|nr:hypothetical protein EVAR_100338_1 [Eumeta japonica]
MAFLMAFLFFPSTREKESDRDPVDFPVSDASELVWFRTSLSVPTTVLSEPVVSSSDDELAQRFPSSYCRLTGDWVLLEFALRQSGRRGSLQGSTPHELLEFALWALIAHFRAT